MASGNHATTGIQMPEGRAVELGVRVPRLSLADRALLIVCGPGAGQPPRRSRASPTRAGSARELAAPWWETPPAAAAVYPVGAGADGSFCHRPNSFPWGSLQVANQPMPGTGPGSFASPPSSFTRAAPALMSSTSK
jgi:hypothetical protein